MASALALKAEQEIGEIFRKPNALQLLEQCHHEIAKQVDSLALCTSSSKSAEFVSNVLDLAIQKLVEQLSWELITNVNASVESVGIPALLDLCIDGVVRKLLFSSAPYKMLEDLMEGQTISNCEKLWDLLETRRERLTTSDFIPQAGRSNRTSLCLLRMCNALLRRLSKTHNTVFCGKILVFLSFTFALSERSAVNLIGKSNVNNLTLFEDQQTFLAAEAEDNAAVAVAAAAAAAASTSGAGTATAMEVDTDPATSGVQEKSPMDYKLYRVFWNIQRFFRQYQLLTESDKEWDAFFEELAMVLTAFEGNAFSPEDLERSLDFNLGSSSSNPASSPADVSSMTCPDASQDHFFQPKYLTNSRLFRLQLRDPILRECMLTQFLILLNHLTKQKAPVNSQTPKSKVSEMQARVMHLLEQTPSDGKGFSKMVSYVLERERNWIKWKLEKCPPYEKYPEKAKAGKDGGMVAPPLKRLRVAPLVAAKMKANEDNSTLMESILNTDQTAAPLLERIQGDSRATYVPLTHYTERFTEAWDPENGIEEEYWPDKNQLHCWRTIRSAMRTKVDCLEMAVNGAGAVVKAALGMPQASSKPQQPQSGKDSKREDTDLTKPTSSDGQNSQPKGDESHATQAQEPPEEEEEEEEEVVDDDEEEVDHEEDPVVNNTTAEDELDELEEGEEV